MYSYKITDRSACRDFLNNPLTYLLHAIEFYGINIGRVTVSQGGAKKIIDLSVNDTFTVFYQDPVFGEYNLRMLLTNKPDYRVVLPGLHLSNVMILSWIVITTAALKWVMVVLLLMH